MNVFNILHQTRHNILAVVNSLTLDQLNEIPPGLNNNIFWNFGHVVVTQQALNYRLSNLPMKVGTDMVEMFKKGSFAQTYSQELLDELKSLMMALVEETKQDYEAGIFKEFASYPTSYGITLNSIDEALAFNNAHEALHFGYMMAIRRMILK